MDRLMQERAPLWEALAKHAAGRRARFHVPAHGGRFAALKQLIGAGARFDLTELNDLDDLHAPTAAIAEAEALAAASIGAAEAHFLVNGTSAGIEALLLATVHPGARALVARDAHQSVVNGLILAGADPVYLRPAIDAAHGRSLGVPASEVVAAARSSPEAVACQLTNPNYYGIFRDYSALPYRNLPPVLVDEAHGVHLYYCDGGPGGALTAGACGTALSMHKSGLALTQSALVAVAGPTVDHGRLRAALRLVQSSSPSYLLMAGLDLARSELATHGSELIERSHERRRRLKERINRIEHLSVWTGGDSDVDSEHPLRLMVSVAALGVTGWQAAGFLADRGVDCELADFTGVLLALGYFGTEADDQRLLGGLQALARERKGPATAKFTCDWPALVALTHERALTPRDAFFAPAESVALADVAGRIAADTVCPYPPGVPLVVPGEVITVEDVSAIESVLQAGGRVHGVDLARRVSAVI